jgi:hypothetical protein
MAWPTAAVLIAIVVTVGGLGAFVIQSRARPRGDGKAKAAERWDDAIAAIESLERRIKQLEQDGA